MSEKVVIVYNEPAVGLYHQLGEGAPVDEVFQSVKAVSLALDHLGYSVQTLPLKPPLSAALEELNSIEAEVVFNLFEGFEGWPESQAAVAYRLEQTGLCFTGCSSHTLRICENKETIKKYLQAFSIPTPDWQIVHPGNYDRFSLDFPCIVKPAREHASRGITEHSVVNNRQALRKQVELVWERYRQDSLVEEFLPGREFRALILGNWYLKVLPLEEIVYFLPSHKPRLLTYAARWVQGDEYFNGTGEKCPAGIDPALKEQIEDLAKLSYKALSCRNYAGIGLRQDKNGRLMVIDVNPGISLSRRGRLNFSFRTPGMDYPNFISEVLYLAKSCYEYA